MPQTVTQRKQQAVVKKAVDGTVEKISTSVQTAEKKIDETVAPVRRSVIKRFPSLFLLLVTGGVTATFTGIEQLLLQLEVLRANPVSILLIGIALLTLTGTLYKKLG